MVKHAEVVKRTIRVVNLDPAAEHFDYPLTAGKISSSINCFCFIENSFRVFLEDIRELIEVDDAMDDEALRFGPNGGLIFCME